MRRIALFTFLATTIWTSGALGQMKTDSLYKRLGGYDAIAAVVDDFIPRIAMDPTMSKFFDSASNDHKKELRQHVVELICEATGGPCFYTGKPMKSAHTGLGITQANWDTAVKHLIATLDKFKVPAKEKDELLKIVDSQRADIVEVK